MGGWGGGETRADVTPVGSGTPVGCVVAEATEMERRGVQEDLGD